MPVSDADQGRVTALLLRDVLATIGPGYERDVEAVAGHVREFAHDAACYADRVVDGFQQQVHDQFIDTAWPRCPRHPHHPMWFQDGAWHADGQRVAALGELRSLLERGANERATT